ncbi:MAG: Dihydroorotate oxidase [Candidatus Nomurabacteria bacterium GW2011_GWF2_43_8]|uniref:Dihydroorotate oxidase n=3 Tax=Candidatus Nomuraibacteriota TaxID=1752729 RepID=A0A0G1FHS6_9BACT|nr:MAG: Dihydroorotate oxidase [Candidatus Nomurabacteria bacterium GW2011_GWA2_43_15]KKT19909.1 MAG: Dihydroorotate oxidase [Candidatus Nomurabacteria bacterium GW2011_GWB1_43_7]KKT21960.1 MAG: Dihydroorotate oxidase [Candidatus Nomurabacteria bacterium GW2011_GWF2_43_8]
MLYEPFYDPEKSYEDNFKDGPFGAFADEKALNLSTSQVGKSYDFFGFKVNSPFGIPAGPLINGNFARAALDKGFDIVTYKTVRSAKYSCHPWPNVLSVKIDGDLTLEKAQGELVADKDYREPLSITNSFGVPSFDPEFWQKDLSETVKYAHTGQIVVGSFQGTKKEGQNAEEYINDYRITAKMLKDTGVKVVEVNFSCPNEGTNNLLCYDIERSAKIARAIKEIIGDIPLIVKIAYYNDDNALRNFVKEIGSVAQGISAINTIPAKIIDKNGEQALPGEGRSRSGICGHAIKWAGLDMVKRLKKLREEFNYSYIIIGVGGVASPEDFFEYRNAGADIVMSATGAMWNPYLARDIKERLR